MAKAKIPNDYDYHFSICSDRGYLNNLMLFPTHPSHHSLPPLASFLLSYLLFLKVSCETLSYMYE